MKHLITQIAKLYLLIYCIISLFINAALADIRFISSYPCSDTGKHCISSGERIVEGIKVTKDCWEWGYTKTCNYPSKDDCKLYEHCYDLGTKGCYLQDSQGKCVNLKKEFSCKSWEHHNKENKTVRTDLVAKDGEDGLVCKGIPCIDGHCVDKSYETNGEMMDSVTKLYAASYSKPDGDTDITIFVGNHERCSKKAVGYSNCCGVGTGWGKSLGASCTSSEKALMKMREDKLCVYVGKTTKTEAGITVLTKHHFCCFNNLLEKAVQEQGRAQLGINFGDGGNADCRGLTLDEIQKLDFSKIDFSEFIEDLKVKFTGDYKNINPADIKDRIEDSLDIKEYDDDPYNPENNKTGLQNKQIDANQDEVWDD